MKYIASVLVVALLVVGIVASCFLANGYSVQVKSLLEVEVGVDHEPAPVIQYHIKKESNWGA